MTSVLYSSGLNYQSGNPVRSEIVAVRREVSELRKQNELLMDENMLYHRYLTKVIEKMGDQELMSQFTRDVQMSRAPEPQQQSQSNFGNNGAPGGGTVQGGGFRR